MRTVVPGQAPEHRRLDEQDAIALSHNEPDATSVEPKVDAPTANALLDKKQKRSLAMIARQAYDRQREHALEDGLDFDQWRHRECLEATGGRVGGFTAAGQRDFRQLRAHFRSLVGDARAFNDAVNGDPEQADRELARHKLEKECQKYELHFPSYPDAICRQQYKHGLGDATTKQLWALFYTVRNRGRQKE